MVCSSFFNIQTFGDFMVWPTGCSYYFYLYFLIFIFILLSLTLYKAEKLNVTKANFLASMAVSSIATTFLSVIGTLIQNRDGIPMIQVDIVLYMVAICIPLVLIWVFKGK